jgi:heme/copper-type cytochrome/quinol oxidase subunit 2
MPWTTVLVVFGSWIVILILTLTYYFVWSLRQNRGDEQDRP